MRKKHFALVLAGILCSSVFMSGCGKNSDDETVVREDAEDEEEEDEDETDSDEPADEDKPQAPAIVKEIDEDTLASQTEVFLKERDEWVIPAEEGLQSDATYYAVTDMNYNGRAELIVGDWSGAVNASSVRIYEINEAGDGFDLLDWSFTGCDSDKKSCPEVSLSGFVSAYYDKKTGISHYLFQDFFLYSFTDGGIRWCDLSIEDGTVVSNAYAMSLSQGSDGNEKDTYYGPDGEMSEQDYTVLTYSYPKGYTLKTVNFGFYYGEDIYSRDGKTVQYMDDDELLDVLKDSYRVFAGRLDYSDFYDRYMVVNDMDPEDLLENSVGSWGLAMTDTEGDITEYGPGDDLYMTLDVYEDMSVHVVEEAGTDAEYAFDMNIFEHGDGSLMGSYMPAASDGRFYDEIVLSITEVNENGMLVVTMSAWAGETYLGASIWYFERLD